MCNNNKNCMDNSFYRIFIGLYFIERAFYKNRCSNSYKLPFTLLLLYL